MSAQPSVSATPLNLRLERVLEVLAKERITRAASAMAFDLFLASIPMLAFVGWLTATLVNDDPSALRTLSSLLNATPAQVQGILTLQLHAFTGGAAALASALGALWLASSAFHTPLGVMEEERDDLKRSWWQKRLIALACVLAGAGALGLSSLLTVALLGGPAEIAEYVLARVTGRTVSLGYLTSLGMALLTLTTLLALFYRIALRRPGFPRSVWPGAAFAVGLGSLSSAAFGYYATHLAQFRLFYGSLAAVAITLGWLWLCCVALLLGAELNLLLERTNATYKLPPREHEVLS